MNPQPPVTRMRIGALTSSGAESTRGEFDPDSGSLAQRLAGLDWTFWGVLALGAFLRFFLLTIKPPHFDEGINGWFVDQMMRNGFYRYDPTNYHGPLHFYILFLSQALFGRHIIALRLPVVLASIGAIFVTLKFEPLVGRRVSRIAALAMAVSPGFIFYGRYAIHEVWLLLFSMVFILGLIGLWKFGTRSYLWCVGAGIAGMILTKETYIIHIGCALIAAGVLWISHRLTPMRNLERARQQWDLADLAMVIFACTFFVIFFYSGTFLNWPGVKGLYQTFATWYQTGSKGNGHEKPWPYWLELALRYEWPIVIGLFLCVVCQFFQNYVIRYLAIYGVGVFAAYSIINYKTPWIIISIVWPLLFIFAAGAAAIKIPPKAFRLVGFTVAGFIIGALLSYPVQNSGVREHCSWGSYLVESVKVTFAASSTSPECGDMGWRLYTCAILGALAAAGLALITNFWGEFPEPRMRNVQRAAVGLGLFVSLGMAVSLNYFRCTTDTEPYVYVQTYNDIYKLMNPVMRLVRNPSNYKLMGHFIRTSTYPFPWLLGDFPNIGYYEQNNSPSKMDADFLVVQSDRIGEVEAKLHEKYYTEPMSIRPYQDPSRIYFNLRAFGKLFRNQPPDFVGKPAPTPPPPR